MESSVTNQEAFKDYQFNLTYEKKNLNIGSKIKLSIRTVTDYPLLLFQMSTYNVVPPAEKKVLNFDQCFPSFVFINEYSLFIVTAFFILY